MGYEHVGRKVAVHIAAEVGRTETVGAVPTGFVAVGRAAGRTAADHIAEEAAVDSIGSVVSDSGTETLAMGGKQESGVAGLAVVELVCYIPPALEDMVTGVRHREKEQGCVCKVTGAEPAIRGAGAAVGSQVSADFGHTD